MTRGIRLVFLLMAIMAAGIASAQRLIAHRGASHDAPENTLAAFNLAWQQGADGVEGDFYLTSDGRIVCIHDKDTQRTAGQEHVVSESTLSELRALDVGAWKHERYAGERMPTFSEVAATVPEGKLFVVELKVGPEIVPPLVDELKKSGLRPEQVAIISFNKAAIAACAQRLPEIRRHWLTSFKRDDAGEWTPSVESVLATLESTNADGLGAQAKREALDDAALKALEGARIEEFHVWTVDEPELAQHYLDRGAVWVTTNRPGWLRERLVKGD